MVVHEVLCTELLKMKLFEMSNEEILQSAKVSGSEEKGAVIPSKYLFHESFLHLFFFTSNICAK